MAFDSVGNLLGEKKAERADVATRASLVLALVMNIFTGCGILFLAMCVEVNEAHILVFC